MVSSSSNPSILTSTAPANTTDTVTNDATVVENCGVLSTNNNNNSPQTRNKEQSSIKLLEAEVCQLWLSNDAIKFQNQYYRETIARIRDTMNRIDSGEVDGTSSSNGVNEDNNGALQQVRSTASGPTPNYIEK